MTDRDLLVELCHDLINRALQCEAYEVSEGYAKEYRDKEGAIRRLIAEHDEAEKLRVENEELRSRLSEACDMLGATWGGT